MHSENKPELLPMTGQKIGADGNPPRSKSCLSLEGVPCTNLHDARLPLDLWKEVREVGRSLGVTQCRISNHSDSASVSAVYSSEMLRICGIEHVPTKLQLVTLFPWHIPCFPQPEVKGDISRRTEIVPRTSLAGICISEVLINSVDVAAVTKQLGITDGRLAGTSANWVNGRDICLHVPVCGPAGIINE